MENFNHYFLDTLKKKYADFNGKATRSEYWYYILFYVLVSFVFVVLDIFLINPLLGMSVEEANKGGILQFVFGLAMLVPSIAVGVRRLHDTARSGWWLLIGLIPVIGLLVLIYFFVQRSK